MKRKTLILFFSMPLILLFALYLHAQEPNEVVKTGKVDIYIGLFDLQNISLDHYVRIPNASVTLINKERQDIVYSGFTDQNGYLHLVEVLPGTYLIGVKDEGGDYIFQDGFLTIKAKEDSKVYLHLEREMDLVNLRKETEAMGIISQFPNLAGKIVEVTNSPFVSLKNPPEREQQTIEKAGSHQAIDMTGKQKATKQPDKTKKKKKIKN